MPRDVTTEHLVLDTNYWTFGVEHELGDWDREIGVPYGFDVDRKDVTVMNSNGVAADPRGRLYRWGGEINTPPTDTPRGQVFALRKIKEKHPHVVVNHRSNLHVHVRVPGLRNDLEALKKIAYYNANNLKQILDIIEPIPVPMHRDYKYPDEFEGARRRYRRRLRSHHTMLSASREKKQLMAASIADFFAAEVPLSEGKPMWHLGIRAAVNLRQLQETDTIEFRHFPGTLDEDELLTCINWCRDYLDAALNTGEPVLQLYRRQYSGHQFPRFPQYVHWMECRYRATCHDGSLSPTIITENIRRIENGEFDEHTGAMSWQQI